eukprot:2241781-Rhodomonas_salina.1
MSGTGIASYSMRYAMTSTDYAIPGTGTSQPVACPMRCQVLRSAMLLPGGGKLGDGRCGCAREVRRPKRCPILTCGVLRDVRY